MLERTTRLQRTRSLSRFKRRLSPVSKLRLPSANSTTTLEGDAADNDSPLPCFLVASLGLDSASLYSKSHCGTRTKCGLDRHSRRDDPRCISSFPFFASHCVLVTQSYAQSSIHSASRRKYHHA